MNPKGRNLKKEKRKFGGALVASTGSYQIFNPLYQMELP
jgi:hypothetical protein